MALEYPTTLPQRTTADTASDHVDDHNLLHEEMNAITNVVHLGPATGVAATDTATWQDALNLANGTNGVYIIAPAGVYWINATLKIYSQTRIEGAGWNDATTDSSTTGVGTGVYEGTTLEWRGGALSARRSLMEAANFSLTTTKANRGIRIAGLMINGRGNSTGNGMTLWCARVQIDRVWIRGWDGTSAGHGIGILLATDNAATGTTLGGGENCFITHSRIDSHRERVKVEAGGQQYTDGVMKDMEFIIEDSGDGDDIADVYMQQAGGWVLDGLHFNGSLGDCIRIAAGSAFTTIRDCFFDGFGLGATSNTEFYGVRVDQFSDFAGGSGGLVIANNKFKHRGGQNTTDHPGVKWGSIYVKPSDPSFDCVVVIQGNTGWRRYDGAGATNVATQGAGTTGGTGQTGNFMMNLNQPNTAVITYVVNGNNWQWNEAGTGVTGNSQAFGDVSTFMIPSSVTSPRSKFVIEGNNFNYGTEPTVGWWPAAFRRYRNPPVASTAMGSACTTSSVGGTWIDMPSYGT